MGERKDLLVLELVDEGITSIYAEVIVMMCYAVEEVELPGELALVLAFKRLECDALELEVTPCLGLAFVFDRDAWELSISLGDVSVKVAVNKNGPLEVCYGEYGLMVYGEVKRSCTGEFKDPDGVCGDHFLSFTGTVPL